jgi:hypothetical protein
LAYKDSVPAVTFECAMDGSGYSACGHSLNLPATGQVTYTNLLPSQHCFSVEAVLAALVSNPARFCWQQNGVPFSITWIAPNHFYPGTTQSANLTIDNPNPKPITIAAGGITIAISSDNVAACPSSNFGVTKGLTGTLTIPANTTETLSAAGVATADWPAVTMFDGVNGANSHTNQDGCEGVGITFTFTGTASGS